MRRLDLLGLALAVSLAAGCAPPAENKPANTNSNTNTAKPVAAAPAPAALLELDKAATEAYFKGDAKYFETFLSDKYRHSSDPTGGKAGALASIAKVKCDVKPFTLEEPQMAMIDADTYVLSYKGTFDGSCNDGPGGKTMKLPSPVRGTTVFVRSGDKWQAAFHGENPIMTANASSDANANANKPADTKKEMPDKEDAAKKEASPAANSNTAASNTAAANSNTAAPAAEKPSANTDALVALEKSGWEAWKAKDAKKLEELSAKSLAMSAPDGSWVGDRAGVIKVWAEMPCENVKTVEIKNGMGTALSPTVEMLTFTGSADGTCYGQKNTSQPGMTLFIKEGDTWKSAFSWMGSSMM